MHLIPIISHRLLMQNMLKYENHEFYGNDHGMSRDFTTKNHDYLSRKH